MRILVVSDTHGHERNLERVLKRTGPVDMLIHCGDVEGHEDYIEALADCPIHIVRGNNDFFTELPEEEVFYIGKKKAFLTHGHYYGVSYNTTMIEAQAREKGVDVVFFGHTHRPLIEINDLTIVNPGSLSYPRQEGRRPSFILMELDKNNELHYHLNYL